MKPLVYYCRWQGATLRLRGRDETAVWGELVFGATGATPHTQPFHYDLQKAQLTLSEGEERQVINLDEMGTALP